MGKATLPVQLALIKAVLALPEDYQIIGVAQGEDWRIVHFLIESPSIPDVPNGTPLYDMRVHVMTEQHPDDPSFRKITVTPKITER